MYSVPIEITSRNAPKSIGFHIKKCLKWVQPICLEGLESIRVMPTPTPAQFGKDRAFIDAGFSIPGTYRIVKGKHATIELYHEEIYREYSRIYSWTPAITLAVARVLFHEIGHHVVATKGLLYHASERNVDIDGRYSKEEAAVQKFADDLVESMTHHCYYKIGKRLARRRGGYHYVQGLIDWKEKRYRQAARSWYSAWCVDNDFALAFAALRWSHEWLEVMGLQKVPDIDDPRLKGYFARDPRMARTK